MIAPGAASRAARLAVTIAKSAEVNWGPHWDGPMPGKRRRLAHARDHQIAMQRWSTALHAQMKNASAADRKAVLLAPPTGTPAQVSSLEAAAREAAKALLPRDVLNEMEAVARDDAKAQETEILLRLRRLAEQAWQEPARVQALVKGSLNDMKGCPLSGGTLPEVVTVASPADQASFHAAVERRATQLLERDLDRLAQRARTRNEFVPS